MRYHPSAKEKINFKKTLALLLIPVLLLSPAAWAKDFAGLLSYITVNRILPYSELSGSFYRIEEIGTDLWVPDLLIEQEDIPEDCYFVFADESSNLSLTVRSSKIERDVSLGALEETVTPDGAESHGLFWINGYSTLVYEQKELDSLTVAIPFEHGELLEFVFVPVSDPDFCSLTSLIMATIQPSAVDAMTVARMFVADLDSYWGENRDVFYSDEDDSRSITVYLRDEGVTSENIADVTD